MNWSATLQTVGFRRQFFCKKIIQVIVFIDFLMLARCLQYLMPKIDGNAMCNEKNSAKNHDGFTNNRRCGQPRIDKYMK